MNDQLERDLAELTRPGPTDAAPQLWRRALEASRAARDTTVHEGGRAPRPTPRRYRAIIAPTIDGAPSRFSPLALAACLALLLGLAVVITTNTPRTAGSRSMALAPIERFEMANKAAPRYGDGEGKGFTSQESAAIDLGGGTVLGSASLDLDKERDIWKKPDPLAHLARPIRPTPADQSDRLIIRKAQIDLIAPDPRAAFHKVALIPSQAHGEFIEESSLTGEEGENKPGLTAILKLRIAIPRLPAALQQLRELGTIAQESSGGDDVTDQVVDLEARLSNERKVETELLALLETRRGEPLEDILKLRAEISRVRESIERMTAQRERLGRLTSLATVLVVIRTQPPAPPPPPEPAKEPGLGAYFGKAIAAAWTSGTHALADTTAWLLQTAVSGLFFWLTLPFLLLLLRATYRKLRHDLTMEPAPLAT